MDELARRVLSGAIVESPKIGARIHANGVGWRVKRGDVTVRVLSPVDGNVVEVGGQNGSSYLRVKPSDPVFDGRNLLSGQEVAPWIIYEVNRIRSALGCKGKQLFEVRDVPPLHVQTLNSNEDWEALWDAVFLE